MISLLACLIPSSVQFSHSVVSESLQRHESQHSLYSPWNSPGQNTGVDSLSLLQGIFPTQGSDPGLLHCRQILSQLSHKGSPRIQEQVAYPFSSGSSRPRNQTRVSCIAGRFFTNQLSYHGIPLLPHRLLQNIEYRSLCCTVGPCWLPIFIYSSMYLVVLNIHWKD